MALSIFTFVLNRAQLPPSVKMVLLALAEQANEESRRAWLSVPTMARKACISERQVQRNLRQLVDAGYLTELGEHRGYAGVTVYRIEMEAIYRPAPIAVPASEPDADAEAAVETEASGAGDKMSPPQPAAVVTGDAGDAEGVTPVTAGGDAGVTQSPSQSLPQPGGDTRARANPLPPASPTRDETPEARRLAFARWLTRELLAADEDFPAQWWAIGRKVAGRDATDDEVRAAILLAARVAKRARGGTRPRFPGQVVGVVDQVAAQWRDEHRQTDLSEATDREGT